MNYTILYANDYENKITPEMQFKINKIFEKKIHITWTVPNASQYPKLRDNIYNDCV